MLAEPGQRRIGRWGLVLAGVTGIIGSGWLFGAAHAAAMAGPAAIWSWVIAAAIISLIAMCLAEVSPLFPQMGGMGRYLSYSHGSLAGFIGDWACFAGIASTVPSEATASVQYISGWDYPWARRLYDSPTDHLTASGIVAASLLCVLYFAFNFYSLRLLMRSLKVITIFKLVVPALTAVLLMAVGWHSANFTAVNGTFAPFGWAGVLSAITMAGIVYAFNGFQIPISFAGEAEHPEKSMPFALFGSLGICLCIYLLLQVAYIAAMPPEALAASAWRNLDYRSPFAELALSLNLNLVALVLYVDAFVSPSGTGLVDMAASARMLYGMEKDGHMPGFLGRLHQATGLPRGGILVALGICFAALWLLPSWNQLAAIISVGYVISYFCGPVSVLGLRRVAPGLRRPVRMPAAGLVSFLAFAANSLLLYWSRWPLTGQIMVIIAAGLLIYLRYELRRGWAEFRPHLLGGLWLVCYLPAMAAISWLGCADFGGRGFLDGAQSHIAVVLASAVFFGWAWRSAWLTPMLRRHLAQAGEDGRAG